LCGSPDTYFAWHRGFRFAAVSNLLAENEICRRQARKLKLHFLKRIALCVIASKRTTKSGDFVAGSLNFAAAYSQARSPAVSRQMNAGQRLSAGCAG
jgi:hypothetical protein